MHNEIGLLQTRWIPIPGLFRNTYTYGLSPCNGSIPGSAHSVSTYREGANGPSPEHLNLQIGHGCSTRFLTHISSSGWLTTQEARALLATMQRPTAQGRIAQLTDRNATERARRIAGYRLLQEYRSQPAMDGGAIEDILLCVSQLVAVITQYTGGSRSSSIRQMTTDPTLDILCSHGTGLPRHFASSVEDH